MTYHLDKIEKGVYGELSKVQEEILEALDAKKQDCELMVLIELSDAIGAIEAYLEKYHPSITLESLIKMSKITKRAFTSGHRQPKHNIDENNN